MNDSVKKKLATALELIEGGDDAVRRKLIQIQEVIDEQSVELAQLLGDLKHELVAIKQEVAADIAREVDEVKAAISAMPTPKDGHTPTKEELLAIITPLIPKVTKQEVVTVVKEVAPNIDEGYLLSLITPLMPDVEQIKKETGDVVLQKMGDAMNEALKAYDEETKKARDAKDTALTTDLLNRAIGIVDSRSSFLINKLNNVSDTVSTLSDTGSFEKISKNLKSYPATLSYSGSNLSSIAYTTPSGTVTKTLNYTGSNLTSIVLSGAIPSGISTTKTLTYSGSTLTGVAYS